MTSSKWNSGKSEQNGKQSYAPFRTQQHGIRPLGWKEGQCKRRDTNTWIQSEGEIITYVYVTISWVWIQCLMMASTYIRAWWLKHCILCKLYLLMYFHLSLSTCSYWFVSNLFFSADILGILFSTFKGTYLFVFLCSFLQFYKWHIENMLPVTRLIEDST